jgi:hypothetical protein
MVSCLPDGGWAWGVGIFSSFAFLHGFCALAEKANVLKIAWCASAEFLGMSNWKVVEF